MSNIYYGLEKKKTSSSSVDLSGVKSDIATNKTNIATNTSDISTNKTNATNLSLKVSTNKTNISTNLAAITGEKTKLGNTRTLLSNLSGQVTTIENDVAANKLTITSNTATAINANTRSKENKLAIASVKSTADTNRQGILITPTSQINYHLYIPDLSNSYQTVQNIPNQHWPSLLMQFGAIDNQTTFRLIGIIMDKDTTTPHPNFNVKFKFKAWAADGTQTDKELYQLELNQYKISGKPYFSINKDLTLRTKFLTETYVKHVHGATNISVEMIVTCAILQFSRK